MLMTKMTELTDGLKSEVSALRAEHFAPSHNNRLLPDPTSTEVKERERVSRAKDVGVSHVQCAPNALLTMHNAIIVFVGTTLILFVGKSVEIKATK